MFGSRLALRLVLLFALVACLPGALVYAVSAQFLGRSIESWFDVRVDRALEGGINLGRSSLDYLLKETSNRASADRQCARRRARRTRSARSTRAAEQVGVYEAALYSPSGSVLAVAGVGGEHDARAAVRAMRCAARGCSRRTRKSSRRRTPG